MAIGCDAGLVERPDPQPNRARLAELQRLLLPSKLPDIGCNEAAAAYRAHNHELDLGGDWYDIIDRPESNSVVAIVGDVVGHGVEQISVMGQLRSASNALCGPCAEPHEILHELDRFARTVPGAAMATVAIVVTDGSSRARIALAGHPPPILISKSGSSRLIETGRRPPLTFGGKTISAEFDLTVGDLLVLFTDGVFERRGESLDSGLRRLTAFIQEHADASCNEIATSIVDDFGAGAEDDQAVIVLRPIHRDD